MNEEITELEAIRDVVNLYAEGLHTGNIETLRSAFHPKAMMYGSSGNVTTIVEIEGLYGFVGANTPPTKSGEPHTWYITSIRYDGNAAAVEMTERAAYGNDYTNYFTLLKIDGKWTIMCKLYNTIPK